MSSLPPQMRHAIGISRTYQHIQLFGSLSVLENAMVGTGPKSVAKSLWEVISFQQRRASEQVIADKASKVLALFGNRLLPNAQAPSLSLSYANRRRLEFARALAGKPILIMLDEPTAGMNPHETYELQRLIYRLREQGITFLIIEHKMFFLEDLADRLVVLAQGKKIAEGSVQQVRADPAVKKAYLGETNAP